MRLFACMRVQPFASVCVVCITCFIIVRILCTQQPIVHEGMDTPAFTSALGEAAKAHVERLAALGVKVAGTEQAERAAPEYILQVLDEIREKSGASIKVEIAVQHPRGSFNTDFLGGINALYENVTNVVCRISPSDAPASILDAVLINAHFDTAIGSPGAADDLSQVGVPLELKALFVFGVGVWVSGDSWQGPAASLSHDSTSPGPRPSSFCAHPPRLSEPRTPNPEPLHR
jgi:hypothetical protein